jgi:hypothetical protein
MQVRVALYHHAFVIAAVEVVRHITRAFDGHPWPFGRVEERAHACHLRHIQAVEQPLPGSGVYGPHDHPTAVAAHLHSSSSVRVI